MTPMPASPFISNSTVIPEPPAVEDPAVALSRTSTLDVQTDAAAEPISQSALASAMTADTAAGPEFADPPVPAAEQIQSSDGGGEVKATAEPAGTCDRPAERESAVTQATPDVATIRGHASQVCVRKVAGVAPGPSEAIPASTGGSQEAPASAPTKNPDAGVLAKCNCEYAHCEDFDRPDCRAKAAGLDPWPDGATDHIHEIFHYVRKLKKQPLRFILDPVRFLAEIEEEPLFIRSGDHLRRWEA